MKITNYQLSKNNQNKWLEFFVAEVAARTTSNLLSINRNILILFYHKRRFVIGYHLSLEVDETL